MHSVAPSGRRVWAISGLITTIALAIPGTRLITSADVPPHEQAVTVTRTVSVSQPVTSLSVQSYGAPIRVTAQPVHHIQIIETITPGPEDDKPSAVTQSVSGGHLTLDDPACETSNCSIGFTIAVPPGVAIVAASQGGPVTVSGTAAANLDSNGGPVSATGIDGPLTVTTGGGRLLLNGLTGPLHADTGGGAVLARGVYATTATIITGGNGAQISFTTAPDTVMLSTDGGPAKLTLPGGPYAVTADSDGGPESVGIATDPAASRSITVSSGGGRLQIQPSAGPR
jgi:hypothetical protein